MINKSFSKIFAGHKWHDIFKVMKEKKLPTRIHCPVVTIQK